MLKTPFTKTKVIRGMHPVLGFAPERMEMIGLVCVFLLANLHQARAAADLFVRDTPADTGIQPNPDTGPMWISEDIWVRNNPDPAWTPNSFLTTSPSPYLPHQNPEYRDPRLSVPCFVYVRVNNLGSTASAGNEKLHVYWAKASTGLSWPANWVDYTSTLCDPSAPPKLYGQEITKPRKNAADATPAEFAKFVNAVNRIDTSTFTYPGGETYWDKQTTIHSQGPEHSLNTRFDGEPTNSHNPAFLPWHREYINRFEILMQQAEPTVTLLYWDWTTDPRTTPNSLGVNVNLFGPTFMGAPGTSGQCSGLTPIGAPFTTTPQAFRETYSGAPPTIWANFALDTLDTVAVRAILTRLTYDGSRNVGMAATLEEGAHNCSHAYFGNCPTLTGSSDNNNMARAPRDPFFFLIHGNVDRLWAMWQRDVTHLDRLIPGSTYGSDASHCIMMTPMRPWKGPRPAECRVLADPIIAPWTLGSEHVLLKRPTHQSVVSPPIYDKAPLLIPPLAPGQSVVLQVPWYPPNRADFACLGTDIGHFCLLARIEDGTTLTEGSDIFVNTKSNNNIAWKNIEVVDDFTGQTAAALSANGEVAATQTTGFVALSSVLVRNPFEKATLMQLRFTAPGDPQSVSLFDYGKMIVTLPPALYQRWLESGRKGQGVEPLANNLIQVFTRNAFITGIRLEPAEMFSIETRFELQPDYPNPAGNTYNWDLIQEGTPDDANAIVGGQRFNVDFNEICLIKRGSVWQYLDDGSDPGVEWSSFGFEDSKWKNGKAALGYGMDVDNPINSGSEGKPLITAYFRRVFDVGDPSLVHGLVVRINRDDGAVIYLNGAEIFRANLPAGTIGPSTFATEEVNGVAEEVFYPIDIPRPGTLLNAGPNVLAVEVHQALSGNAIPDMRFDLELCVNSSVENYAPYVAFQGLADGGLYQVDQPVVLRAEGLDTDGSVDAVEFFLDSKSLAVVTSAPFQFTVPTLPFGSYRVSAVASDNRFSSSATYGQINVVSNLLPLITLTSPMALEFPEHAPITISASASDPAGQVEQVEFFVQLAWGFTEPAASVGVSVFPPYTITIDHLPAGPYMISAIAKDNSGQYTQAAPIHIEVMDESLKISYDQGKPMITWTAMGAMLETASEVTGAWVEMPSAVSPYSISVDEKRRFYRLKLAEHTHE